MSNMFNLPRIKWNRNVAMTPAEYNPVFSLAKNAPIKYTRIIHPQAHNPAKSLDEKSFSPNILNDRAVAQ